MRIAQVSPLFESVPPKLYGGTERVVSYLTEDLVLLGHEVTLFASSDSVTGAKLRSHCPALRLAGSAADPVLEHLRMIQRVFRHADEFDVIHFHVDTLHFPRSARSRMPVLTTLHGRLDVPGLDAKFQPFRALPFVSISNAQRTPMPWLNWVATTYHGLPRDLYELVPEPQDYLAFLGRISPEKRVDRAIEIARRAGMPLRVAAKIDDADRDYFEAHIRDLLRDPLVEYLGELGEVEKGEFLGNARALLFPVDWPEPFGLVMIEAMACGTPVIAYPCGSVPEVVDDGVTGFIVDSIPRAVEAVERIGEFSRTRCRRAFERRFTARRMAKDYLHTYRQLVAPKALDAAPSKCHDRLPAGGSVLRPSHVGPAG